MASKKISGNRQYSMLSGVLKKRGIERIRFVFTGMDVHTKKMKAFFIEIYVLNPIVSPKRPVLSSEIKVNTTLVPSYVSIIFGAY